MINNYLKMLNGRLFFFNARDEASRGAAWHAARSLEKDPARIAVWASPDYGRYPRECPGLTHPVVGPTLEPISPECRVVGYSFQSRIPGGLED